MAKENAEIAALEKQAYETDDPAARERLYDKITRLTCAKGQAAEGEMYSGKNNDAAMRETETAKAKLGQLKRDTRAKTPDDFPLGYINEFREMMRQESGNMKLNPSQAEIVAWWEPRKDRIKLNPSQQKFRGPKGRTIPEAVKQL